MIGTAHQLPILTGMLGAVVAATASGVLVRLLMNVRLAVDAPNDRSLHSVPTPRTGGVGVIAGIVLGTWVSIGVMQSVVWFAVLLAMLSFADDRWNLSVAVRLPAHILCVAIFVLNLGEWSTVPLLLVAILGIGWITNLYNFMDGADGLAGGMTIFGFGAYAVAALLQGHNDVGLLSLCVASAAAGFLVFNISPARIFLGDVGSIPIGFLAGTIGLLGWREGLWPPEFPIIVFAPFIVDASVTLAKRALRGQPVWRAHREHYYQRLILCGWSHHRTAMAEFVLMTTCSCAGLYAAFATPMVRFIVVVCLALLMILLMVLVDRMCRAVLRPGKS